MHPDVPADLTEEFYADAQRLTQEVLRMETVQEVKGRLFGELKKLGMIELVEMYH